MMGVGKPVKPPACSCPAAVQSETGKVRNRRYLAVDARVGEGPESTLLRPRGRDWARSEKEPLLAVAPPGDSIPASWCLNRAIAPPHLFPVCSHNEPARAGTVGGFLG